MMTRFVTPIRSVLSNRGARNLLMRTGGIIGARVAGAFLALVYTAFLARVLDPGELGLAMTAMSTTFLVSVFLSLNIESGAIRFLIQYQHAEDIGKMAGFVAFSRRIIFWTTPVLALILLGVAVLWGGYSDHAMVIYGIALLTAPILALTRIYSRHASALNAVIRGMLPRMLIRPLLFTLAIGIMILLGAPMGARFIVILFLGTAILVLGIQAIWLRDILAFARDTPPDTGPWRNWSQAGFWLIPMLITSEFLKDLVITSAALAIPADAVAQFSIAFSLMALVRFAMVAVDMAFSPRIARALMAGPENPQARRLILASGLLKTGTLLSGALVIFLFRDLAFGLFGPHYLAASHVTFILLGVPLSLAVLGPAVTVLNVLGHQRDILISCLGGICLIVAGTYIGGRLEGVSGAAIGATCGVIAQQLALWGFCLWRTGQDVSIFAALGPILRREPLI